MKKWWNSHQRNVFENNFRDDGTDLLSLIVDFTDLHGILQAHTGLHPVNRSFKNNSRLIGIIHLDMNPAGGDKLPQLDISYDHDLR